MSEARWQASARVVQDAAAAMPARLFGDVKDKTIADLCAAPGGKTAQLRVRNEDQNEDEDGAPNMRGGATNYFVFPGDSGADAAWLQGAKWRGVCEVAFEARGATYAISKLDGALAPRHARFARRYI